MKVKKKCESHHANGTKENGKSEARQRGGVNEESIIHTSVEIPAGPIPKPKASIAHKHNNTLAFDYRWPRERSPAERGPGRGRAALVARAVDPLGCVVASPPAAPPPPLDADLYTRDNRDEATFRPVVRAPAALPPHPHVLARPLPRTTTIPVQSLHAPATPPPPTPPSRPRCPPRVRPRRRGRESPTPKDGNRTRNHCQNRVDPLIFSRPLDLELVNHPPRRRIPSTKLVLSVHSL
ncbi:uncharacterized protein ACR2FA_004695 [Aphomia sociella]